MSAGIGHVFGLALLPLLAGLEKPAAAFQVSFYPFFGYERVDNEQGSEARANAFGPIVDTSETSRSRAFAVHPLLYRERNERSSTVDILYPLFHSHTSHRKAGDEIIHTTFLLPFYWHGWTEQGGERRRESRIIVPFYYSAWKKDGGEYKILFPFYWKGSNASIYFPIGWRHGKAKFLSIWPLFGDFEKLWGRDHISFLFWPLYIHSRRGADESWSVPYPFFAVTRGPNGWGVRCWPLFDHRRYADGGKRDLLLWPFFHRYVTVKDGNWSTRTLALPFYIRLREPRRKADIIFPITGRIETATRISKIRLWPLYTRTETKGTDEVLQEFLWNFIQFGRIEGRTIVRVFPLFEVEKRPGRDTLRVAWPLYTRRHHQFTRHEFRQSFLAPLWITNQRRYGDGSEEISQARVPLYRYQRDRKDAAQAQSLWPLWVVSAPRLERTWAPLFSWFRWRREPNGDGETRVFGRLYRRISAGGRTARSIELLGARVEFQDGDVRFRFLWFS